MTGLPYPKCTNIPGRSVDQYTLEGNHHTVWCSKHIDPFTMGINSPLGKQAMGPGMPGIGICIIHDQLPICRHLLKVIYRLLLAFSNFY